MPDPSSESPRSLAPPRPTGLPLPGRGSEMVLVRIGEIRVVSGGQTIRTLLGSCVGIALYDPRSGIGGLAHIVLPQSRGSSELPGKFVDTAVPALIDQIARTGGDTRNLRAKIAGGAQMLGRAREATIGELNVAAIQRELANRRIPLLGQHCGGQQGRRMLFAPESGYVRLEIMGSDDVEI